MIMNQPVSETKPSKPESHHKIPSRTITSDIVTLFDSKNKWALLTAMLRSYFPDCTKKISCQAHNSACGLFVTGFVAVSFLHWLWVILINGSVLLQRLSHFINISIFLFFFFFSISILLVQDQNFGVILGSFFASNLTSEPWANLHGSTLITTSWLLIFTATVLV